MTYVGHSHTTYTYQPQHDKGFSIAVFPSGFLITFAPPPGFSRILTQILKRQRSSIFCLILHQVTV